MGQGGGTLFLITQMGQNTIDNVLVLNARNHPDRSTALTANLYIDTEYALEPLGPGHGDVPFSG